MNKVFHLVHFECSYSNTTYELGEDGVIGKYCTQTICLGQRTLLLFQGIIGCKFLLLSNLTEFDSNNNKGMGLLFGQACYPLVKEQI